MLQLQPAASAQLFAATFAGTTAAGFRGLGGNPIAPPVQNVNNLGAFSLATTPFTYTGNIFTLRVTFTAPEGITGSNTSTFSATLIGTVTNDPNSGGVQLDFNNTPDSVHIRGRKLSGDNCPWPADHMWQRFIFLLGERSGD